MSAPAVVAGLEALAGCGVTVETDGARLHVEAPAGVIGPIEREWLAEHKAELVALLTPGPRRGYVPLDEEQAVIAACERVERESSTPIWRRRLAAIRAQGRAKLEARHAEQREAANV